MKIIFSLIMTLSITVLNAQFREQSDNSPKVQDRIIVNNSSGFFLSFINPENFSMRHSVSMSYSASGGDGLALGIYTNSMSYKFADNLNVQLDASILHSPYSTFGENFGDRINGIYLSRAAINYRPLENMFISFQYRNQPLGAYRYWNGFYPVSGRDQFDFNDASYYYR